MSRSSHACANEREGERCKRRQDDPHHDVSRKQLQPFSYDFRVSWSEFQMWDQNLMVRLWFPFLSFQCKAQTLLLRVSSYEKE